MTTDSKQLSLALVAPFPADAIHWKPLAVKGNRALAAAYLDARAVMQRLDCVLGVGGWKDSYQLVNGGSVVCTLSVKVDGEWVEKSDVGSPSEQPDDGDKLKAAFCVPLDAQALTPSGWAIHSELSAGDLVLGYDLSAMLCRWTKIESVNVFPKTLVLGLRSKSFNADCTADHRWVIHRRGSGVSMKRFCDLDSRDRIVVAAPAESGHHPLTPREAAIIGWLATDGSVRVGRDGRGNNAFLASIHQSKLAERYAIRELLGSDAGEYVAPGGERLFPGQESPSVTIERSMFTLKNAFAKSLLVKAGLYSGEPIDWRLLSPLVTQLTAESRAAMFSAMLAGDGHKSDSSSQIRFGKKRKPGVLDAFEILCALQGIALGTLHGSDEAGKIPLRTLREKPHTWNKCIEIVPVGRQPVWCPTTALGTWVMKWNGQITITGNSDALKRAAIKLGIGRYLYRLPSQWVDYDPQRKQFVKAPTLPAWALPSTKQTA